MKLFRINSPLTALRALIAWPLLLLGLYMLAALLGSLIPVNDKWRPPASGVTVFIYDNGIHTSLILPRKFGHVDLGMSVAVPSLRPWYSDNVYDTRLKWPERLPASHFPGDIDEYPYIMIGWGDARFYRETPTWGDVRPSTALVALFGSGQTLTHVDRLATLPSRDIRTLVLRREEFIKLLRFILSHFPNGDSAPYVAEPGYSEDDRFYAVRSAPEGFKEFRYSALFNCNNWVGTALAQAGVKTGYWTPLPFGVMWWLPQNARSIKSGSRQSAQSSEAVPTDPPT